MGTTQMKRKALITFISLCLSITLGLSITACGKQETTFTEENITEESITTETEVETEKTTTSNGNGKDTTTETSKIPESKGWTDYKKTIEYYKEQGLMSDKAAYVLNPDIYGTETAGKSTAEIASGNSACVDAAVETRKMKVTTTKGYPIEAWYYVEAGTVQFIYTGEVSPGGAWYIDPDSDDVLDAYFNYEKSILDITHEQKIQILGEPTMTAEEVIAALQ